jgi:hypothetical protein
VSIIKTDSLLMTSRRTIAVYCGQHKGCVEMLVSQLAVRGIATRLEGTRTAALCFSSYRLLIVARCSHAEGCKDTPASVAQGTSTEFFWRRAGEPFEGRAPPNCL